MKPSNVVDAENEGDARFGGDVGVRGGCCEGTKLFVTCCRNDGGRARGGGD